ncbi:hypothetical protein ACHAWO_012292 [Cyclotella atomus]|uniref:Uncharacterized protein n=1 Tax=Cyclotella atomus TaxID=382360 RepID=A0ABD3PIA5_9STRA
MGCNMTAKSNIHPKCILKAAGEFTTLTSLEDPTFKIQERFTAVDTNSCGQASVSTGVAFRDTNKPVLQISTPRAGGTSLNEVNGCPIDLYVDGEAQYLDINLTSSHEESDRHTDTYVTLDAVVRASASFGCYIMVQVALPGSFGDGETLLGLLGVPYEDATDDWRTLSGEVLQAPATEAESLFSTAYSYCVENWVPFSSEVEDAVLNLVGEPALNQELADAYDGSLVCLVDGVCGGVSYALAALGNEQVIIETQVEVKAAIFPREEVKVENVVTIAEEEDTNKPIPTAPKTADSFWYPAWDKGSTEKDFSSRLRAKLAVKGSIDGIK